MSGPTLLFQTLSAAEVNVDREAPCSASVTKIAAWSGSNVLHIPASLPPSGVWTTVTTDQMGHEYDG